MPNLPSMTSKEIGQMREIAKAVYENPALLADFARDPEATAKSINGFTPPAGYHIHVADENNKLYPAEEAGRFGAADLNDWSRVEFRAGHKTFSLVVCM